MRDGSRAGVLERITEKKAETVQTLPAQAGNGHTALTPTPIQPEIKPRPMVVHASTYKIETPVGKAYVTVNSNGEGRENPFEVFVTVGKAGSDVAAMADGIGRLISLVLRMASPLSEKERVKQVIHQLGGIGGSRHVGFGEKRVRSLPDAISKVLGEHIKSTNGQATLSTNGHGVVGNGHAETQIETEPVVPAVVAGAQPLFAKPVEFDLCPSCGEALLAHEEGCKKCYGCGYSEC